jgi:hypothetical protein
MKPPNNSKRNQGGFTVVEMVVSSMILAILGIVFFNVLNSGMVLYAKNTAVNSAHEEGRHGINRLTRDIHASVSVPQLRDTSFNVVSSTPVGGVPPTAAGVSFQNIVSGPNYVWKDPGAPELIMIKDGATKPTEGMHILIPFWNVEDDIIKVTASGTPNHTNIFMANGQEQVVANKAPPFGGTTYAITYYTERAMYLVKNGVYIADSEGPYILSSGNYVPYTSGAMQRYRYEKGELHLYKQAYVNNSLVWQDKATVARYISTPAPFYVPLNSSGSPETKYVGVRLSARDPGSSNRGYLATAALLDTQIDYRSRIALYQ